MGSDVEKLWKGDGMAWRREQADILKWAKNLYYPESGGSLIPETDDKATWDAWKNKFLSWKDSELAKPETNRWWYTYPRRNEGAKPIGGGKSGGGKSGGGTSGGGNSEASEKPIGPYPIKNVYFPQLTQAYERPAAQDWGAPLSGLLGDPLLYQPWTSDYRDKYGGIMEYQPPQLNVGRPRFSPNVTGALKFGEPGIPKGWLDYLGPAQEPEPETTPPDGGGK